MTRAAVTVIIARLSDLPYPQISAGGNKKDCYKKPPGSSGYIGTSTISANRYDQSKKIATAFCKFIYSDQYYCYSSPSSKVHPLVSERNSGFREADPGGIGPYFA